MRQPKNFILTELRLLPDCNDIYRKVLADDVYRFNQLEFNTQLGTGFLEREIFGGKIFIQAVVGKNGSGKSSVLEIIYRIINNFSYYILKGAKLKRESAEPIFLIEELYADLDFIIDDKPCSIKVRNKSIGVIHGDRRIFFGKFQPEFEGYEDYNKRKESDIVKLASSFFYTIVTNYSFQSLIASDFSKDIAHDFIDSKDEGYADKGDWLDSLFRKNDGYVTPIVLNPYRENGTINLQREYILTLSRISALLIQSNQHNKEFLSGYRFATINYKSSHQHFLPKLFDKKYRETDLSIHLSAVIMALADPLSIARFIIHAYNLELPIFLLEKDAIPYAYLIYKTLNVLKKYAQFETYDNIPKVTQFAEELNPEAEKDLNDAIEELRSFESHVNIKIRQTLNFLRYYNDLPEHLNLQDYLPFKELKKFTELDLIIEQLPPPFYEQDIRLFRGKNAKEDLPLSSLSSGERQFIYTLSTVVYHVKNLLSIQQSERIRYRNINLVLDEVEICFHPEYQRQFINRLLELLTNLHMTRNCSFNILLVTHSPFLLSDIPKNNIMYLTDGRQEPGENMINPFAANINDILYQSFFLDGGFIGEHAKNQIWSAANAMERLIAGLPLSKNSIWDRGKLRQLIDMIGEPLLRDNLLGLFLQAFEQRSYEEILDAKDREIAELRQMLLEKGGLEI